MKAPGRGRLLVLLVVLVLVAGAVLWLRMDFKRPLVAAVRRADRVEIAVQPPYEGPDPFLLEGRDRVEGLLHTLDFQFSLGTSYCMCGGDTVLEFRDGDLELATLTYHHGTHLRWSRGPWGTDVFLTPESQERLVAFLRDQGYERLHSLREERLAEEKRDEDETTRFYGYFPNGRIENSEGKELVKAVFRAFSATALSWTTTGDKERRAIEALSTVTEREFLEALSEIEDDRKALLGFARFFFFDGHDARIPEDERDAWALRLAHVVLEEWRDDDKPLVLRRLWDVKTTDADIFLRAVLEGKYPTVESAHGEYGEPGLEAQATLALAFRGDTSVEDRILEMLRGEPGWMDRAALEVALAALGDPSYLKRQHFILGSYTIGYGGLRVIEMYRGEHGMDALVHGALEHPWAAVSNEAEAVFERITGKKAPKRTVKGEK